MYKAKDILFLKAITPMHVGSGSDLGIVDLPIQRERHTGFPKIEGSSLKGALREMFESLIDVDKENRMQVNVGIDGYKNLNDEWKIKVKEKNDQVKEKSFTVNWNNKDNVKANKYYQAISLIFGPDKDGSEYAGALGITDARLLLFPVKSVKGVFAWITCPGILKKFKDDLGKIGVENNFFVPEDLKDDEIIVNNNPLVIDGKVVLEEYTFKVSGKGGDFNFLDSIDFVDKDKVAIVSDDTFRDFTEMSTEVITRVKIGDSGTVEPGALWTEEYLPAETVLYNVILATDIFSKDKGIFSDQSDIPDAIIKFVEEVLKEGFNYNIFIGGNTTIGKGLTQVKLLKTDNNGNQ